MIDPRAIVDPRASIGTAIGGNKELLTHVPIARDRALGHHEILANNAASCACGTVGDGVNVGSHALVTQLRRIGAHARVHQHNLNITDALAQTDALACLYSEVRLFISSTAESH